ncbi:MAG: hypothetical protein ABIA77_04830 [Candidatus Omnitrophota bacterium]
MVANYWIFPHVNLKCERGFREMIKKKTWQFTKKLRVTPRKGDEIIFYLSDTKKEKYFVGQAIVGEFSYTTTRKSVDDKTGVCEVKLSCVKEWSGRVAFDGVKLRLDFIRESMKSCTNNPSNGIGLALRGKSAIKINARDYGLLVKTSTLL